MEGNFSGKFVTFFQVKEKLNKKDYVLNTKDMMQDCFDDCRWC